jgi:hypothetical protein
LIKPKHEFSLSGVGGIDFDAETVSDDLTQLAGPIRVRLNSGGGITFDDTAINVVLSDKVPEN